MKKYIFLLLIINLIAAQQLEKVTYSSLDNDNVQQQLELATMTLYFDGAPSAHKVFEKKTEQGFVHVRYFFDQATLSDASRRSLQDLLRYKNNQYYITYEQATEPAGITLDVYYDPRYVTHHAQSSDGINFEQQWVLHFYNAVLLDMYQHDDKPLIQFA